MTYAAENMMRQCRAFLAIAAGYEHSRRIELADAAGAIAANKIAAAIRIDERADRQPANDPSC